jgi:hypothetical protein
MQAKIQLTPAIVKHWAHAHLISKGHLPTIQSTELTPDGSTWREISEAMQNGLRDWPSKKRQSLKKFLSMALKDYSFPLTHAKLQIWEGMHFTRYGVLPNSKTEEPSPCGASWATVYGYASPSGQQRKTGIKGRRVKAPVVVPLVAGGDPLDAVASKAVDQQVGATEPTKPVEFEQLPQISAPNPVEQALRTEVLVNSIIANPPFSASPTAPIPLPANQIPLSVRSLNKGEKIVAPTTEAEILLFAQMFTLEHGRMPVIASDDLAGNGMKWEELARLYTNRGVLSIDGIGTTKGKYITDLIQNDPLANPRYVNPTLVKKLILEYYHLNGRMPKVSSGFASDRMTWSQVGDSMRNGRNGWPKDDCIRLADFIVREFPVLPERIIPLVAPVLIAPENEQLLQNSFKKRTGIPLNPTVLKKMLAEHFAKYGSYPKCNCRIPAPDGSTWASINTACSTGVRGWPKDQTRTLKSFIEEHFLGGVPRKSKSPVKQIIYAALPQAAHVFIQRPAAILQGDPKGRLLMPWMKKQAPVTHAALPPLATPAATPVAKPVEVVFVPRPVPELDVDAQNRLLMPWKPKGSPGVPEGQGAQEPPVVDVAPVAQATSTPATPVSRIVTEAVLAQWMLDFFNSHNRFPHNGEDSIAPDGSTWRALNAVVRQGIRGWNGKKGMTLRTVAEASFPDLFKEADESNLKFPLGFGLDMLLMWIRDYFFMNNGEFPTKHTLKKMPSGHRWSSVDDWCDNLLNGMPALDFSGKGAMTLARMVEHVKRRLRDEGIIPNDDPQQGSLPGM